MSILKDLTNPNNPVTANTSGALSGLAVNGVLLSTTPFSNMSGDAQGGGYPYAYGVLTTDRSLSGNWSLSGNQAVYGWVLPALDGTNYETCLQQTGTTTTAPKARAADFTWPFDANGSGQVILAGPVPVPICSGNKMLFWNTNGALLAGSGTICNLYFVTDGTT